MKRTRVYATLMVMGVFAYLLMAITFWQSAMAQEADASKTEFAHLLYFHNEKRFNQLAQGMIVGQIEGQLTGWIDATATIISAKDGTEWLDNFTQVEQVMNECPIYKFTRQEVANMWVTFTSDKKQLSISVSTVLFVNQVCDEQFSAIAQYAALPSAKPKTSAKEGS